MTQAPESATPTRPLGLSITSFDPAFSADPHRILDELREHAPVVYDPVLQRVVLTRAADVEAVLRDRDLFVDGRKAPEGSMMRMLAERRGSNAVQAEPSMLQLDPPDHDRLRGLVNKAFTPRAVDAMAPRIQEIANELLEKVAGREQWDLIGDFSAPLPTIVIAEMLGVDPHMQKQFKLWSDAVVQGFNPFLNPQQREEIEAAGTALSAYLRSAIDERRANRRNDLITALIEAEENGDQLTDQEIVTMVTLLLLAGNLTTTDLIGNGMYAFLTHRDQWELLVQRPDLVANAVEEMLRFDPPVTQSGRLTLKEMEVGGCPVHAGQTLSPILLAANHDPAANPDPHRFDITREEIHHVSFGGGRRYCLGAPLARLEARIAVGTLARRFPDLQLAAEKPSWRNVPVFRGLVTLPVRHR
jgi:cytochrome P450